MSQVLLHSTTHQSKSCTTIHCKKVFIYALTATDCPCCSTSTLYPFPSPRNCSAISRTHCTRTDTASDPRRARYTDTVTFLTASVGAGRRKRTTWESNSSSNGTWTSCAHSSQIFGEIAKGLSSSYGMTTIHQWSSKFSRVQVYRYTAFGARKRLRLMSMKMLLILKYACQFMIQQNQRPWTHIQIMHVRMYLHTYDTSLV